MALQRLVPIMGGLGFLLMIGITKSYLMPFKSPSASSYFVSPSAHMEHFTFGYRELVADLLWLRTIQNVDQCERVLKENELCRHSWVYKMVDKVTDLSPQFRIIYATVPLLLSITVNDPDGAVSLLEKGLRYFPNDWPILYRGGYLHLFDRGDKVKAAEYFLRAQKNGGPEWLASYATRLYSESGRLDLAEQVVKEYENSGLPEEILKRMSDRLREASKKIK